MWKFSRPTNWLLSPNASCSWNEYQMACAAGQKKKTMVMALAGLGADGRSASG